MCHRVFFFFCILRHLTFPATSCHTSPLTCPSLWNTFTCRVTASPAFPPRRLKALRTSKASFFGKSHTFLTNQETVVGLRRVTGDRQSLSFAAWHVQQADMKSLLSSRLCGNLVDGSLHKITLISTSRKWLCKCSWRISCEEIVACVYTAL